MLFNSATFLGFFILLLAVYYAVPHRFKWIVLLVASIFFYVCFTPIHILILLCITAASYAVGRLVYRGAEREKKPKLWLALGTVFCFSFLFIYKYLDFFISSAYSLLDLFSIAHSESLTSLLLPVGISFFSFKAVSYMVDCYRGKTVEKNFFKYLLYVSFFPQIASGPIERSTSLIPAFSEEHRFDTQNIQEGLYLMLIGYFKKMVVADNISAVVSKVFSDPQDYSPFILLFIACMYSIQILCDFSGYSDIAIGCAKAFGIRTAKNFNHPYFSTSIATFWRNWHISLSSWFRDYLYIPLGGNRKGTFRKYLNLLIVFLVSGLWHGAAWNFVFWGLLHAAYQIVGALTAPWRQKLCALTHLDKHDKLHTCFNVAVTFLLVTIAWIFFRSSSITDGFHYIKCMFVSSSGTGGLSGIITSVKQVFNSKTTLFSFCAALASFVLYGWIDYKKDLYALISRRHTVVKVIFYALSILFIFLFASTSVTDFIYVRF